MAVALGIVCGGAASCDVYDASLTFTSSASGSAAGGDSSGAGLLDGASGSVVVPEPDAGANPASDAGSAGWAELSEAGAAGAASSIGGNSPIGGAGGASAGSAGRGVVGGAAGATGGAGTGGGSAGAGGGGAGTGGGSAGSGGASPLCANTSIGSGTIGLIDDLDDGNAFINPIDGRSGSWIFSSDGTGTTVPAPGAATPTATGESGLAEHTQGSGLTKTGAALVVSLVPAGDCYDASAYRGVNVALKGTGQIEVSVLTAAVNAQPAAKQDQYKATVTLTNAWQDLSFAWTDLHQSGYAGATALAFDTSKITAIQFSPHSLTQPISFDFTVDNLAFRKKP